MRSRVSKEYEAYKDIQPEKCELEQKNPHQYADRIAYQQGDFVALAPQLPQADIVTLQKVICCYPDMRALVGLSSARAGKLYGGRTAAQSSSTASPAIG
jgi:hypothetical protein